MLENFRRVGNLIKLMSRSALSQFKSDQRMLRTLHDVSLTVDLMLAALLFSHCFFFHKTHGNSIDALNARGFQPLSSECINVF